MPNIDAAIVKMMAGFPRAAQFGHAFSDAGNSLLKTGLTGMKQTIMSLFKKPESEEESHG
jgi:hypothetical protein